MESNKCSLKNPQYLDTIRALHQTIVSLRGALESSRSELVLLKTKTWPIESLESAITALSIENHILRQKIVDVDIVDSATSKTTKQARLEYKDTLTSDKKNISFNLNEKKPYSQDIFIGEEIRIYPPSNDNISVNENLDIINSLDPTNNALNYKNVKSLNSTSLYKQNNEGELHNIDSIKTGETDVSNRVDEKKLNASSRIINQDFTKEAVLNKEKPAHFCANKDPDILDNQNKECNNEEIVTLLNANEVNLNKNPDKNLSVAINVKVYKSSRKILNFKTESKMSDNQEPNENSENKTQVKNEIVLQHSCSTDVLDQEVDDIELIFTNEDIKETNLKEPLISIDGGNDTQTLHCPDFDQNLSTEVSDKELEDDVFNDNFENENNENTNFQSQTFNFTRENSQIYNSKSDNSINQDEVKSLKSYYSYQDSSFENKSLEKDESFDRFEERVRIVETDMSKVGIHDVEYSMGRRNTCPNPLPYRPIWHRDAITRGSITRKSRPILAHSNAIRKESGAQTDISALPNKCSWRSESSLINKVKVFDNFTTLPSKYPLPGTKLRLTDKTVESRRVLLSDIGFTSMVPELSRSADHLFPPQLKTPVNTTYGQFLKTSDLYSPGYTSQRFGWNIASPSESHSQSRYSSIFPISSPPVSLRRCSAPVSPCRKNIIKNLPAKVRFANGSLPELRSDWNSAADSGDSTDSLVEEAEQYLRRSIDCMVGSKNRAFVGLSKTGIRRASAPEPAGDNIPPQGWMPFLPRLPRDLRLDYWVKVISPEGRVRGGRVRFVGHLLSHSDQFVGVQLSTPDGYSDGTYNNRRYFQCEPCHGIFVPFKKVIMGWKP